MALDVSALAAYVKDNAEVLITAAVTEGITREIVMAKGNVLTGIKTSERIGVLDQDIVFANGDGCGFTAAGDTRITQRTLTVGNVKVEDSICVNLLEKKYTQLMMKKGNSADKLPEPIEHTYVDQRMSMIKSELEIADWRGYVGHPTNNYSYYDGILKVLDGTVGAVAVNGRVGTGTITGTTAAATIVGVGTAFTTQLVVGDKIYAAGVLLGAVSVITDATHITLGANLAANVTAGSFNIVAAGVTPITSVTGVTASNVLGIVDSVILAIPEAVMSASDEGGQPIIWMGWDMARLYLMALKNANLFHFTSEDNMLRDGFNVPGFAIRVQPTPGLSGTNRIVAIAPKNMWFGTDLEHEEEEVDFHYEWKDDALLSRVRFKSGWQIGFPDEAAQFLLA